MAVSYIPKAYHTVTPYLIVERVDHLIDFCKKAFDAKITTPPTRRPDGSIAHAEVQVGDSPVMMGEPMGEQFPPMPGMLHVYVPDVDALYKKAIESGGTSLMEPADQFYGDRTAGVKDPCGNMWWLATHVEDVTPEEAARRAAEKAQADAKPAEEKKDEK